MKNYETVIVLTPTLSEEDYKNAVIGFKDILTAGEAEIIHVNNWGLKKLAYPIKKKTNAYYAVIEFKAPPEVIKKLETECDRDEKVLRFLTVSLDKHAVSYNERKRLGLLGKKKVKTEEKSKQEEAK